MTTDEAHEALAGSSFEDVKDLQDFLASLPSHIWIRFHDQHQIRQKLRLSLVEHCNYRCFFCHNESQGPIQAVPGSFLTLEEINSIVRAALSEGVTKVKLTGGEPLLYRSGAHGIIDLVQSLTSMRDDLGTFDLSMTTNASLMPEYATRLKSAGLDRVTMSLTTLNESTFANFISRNGHLLSRSIEGLRSAFAAQLLPLKINAVIYYSPRESLGNLTELGALLNVAQAGGATEFRVFTLLWHQNFPRFGEFYQYFSHLFMTELAASLARFDVPDPASTVEILATLGTLFADCVYPKVEFGVTLGSMRLGFEAMKFGRLGGGADSQEGPYAMRVAADGALRTALNSPPAYDVIKAVRSDASDEEVSRLYRQALEEMP